MCAAIVVAFAVMVAVECVLCNMPFWRSLAASGDSAAAYNVLGPGLERTDEGLLKVTDPTQAYMQVDADGSSEYVRMDPVSSKALDKAARQSEQVLRTVRVRPDVNRRAGTVSSVSVSSPRSLYVHAAAAGGSVCVRIVEPKGSLIPFDAVRANVRVPFALNPLRIGVMVAVLAMVLVWRPGSRLWRMPLDTTSVRQRAWLGALLAVPVVVTCAVVVWQLVEAAPLSFHTKGTYTYDFDQYDYVARALLDGHAWLDLDVPDALRDAADPYDVATRQRLLADGVSPVYWDYAFYQGHWYSYFGVVPALLLFLPYRAVTSLFVDGGLMMPCGAAVPLLMLGFLVFGCLLVIRVISRIRPNAPLAAVSMLCVFMLLASNGLYLWYRTNFYSVPIAASLFLSVLGLWLWLGAAKRVPVSGDRIREVDGTQSLSLPHLAAGSMCIAANLGCRPQFILVALLAFVIFWPQIQSIFRHASNDSSLPHMSVWRLMRAPLAALLPALIVIVPLLAYNVVRFGSPLDFGTSYQMTVTDMTSYRQPLSNLALTVAYYLFLPLRFTDAFPFLAVSPSPLPTWGFTEAMPGGLFTIAPLTLAALACPFLYRRMRKAGRTNTWLLLTSSLALGLLLVVIDSRMAGLGWRYIADFGWLFALVALPSLLIVLDCGKPLLRWVCRAGFLALLLFTLVVALMSLFLPGRDDEMLRNNPALYLDVQSWFMLG